MKKKILVLAGILMGCGLLGQVQMAAGAHQTMETAKEKAEENQAAMQASESQSEQQPERTATGIQDEPQAELVRVGEKKEEFEASGVLVHINAQVEAYEGDVPVVKVKPHILTSQELKQWKEVLFPGTDLYEYFGTEERKAVYSFHNMDYLLGETTEDVLPEADEPHDLFFHASRINTQCGYELRSVERTVEGKKLHCIEAGNYAREKGQLPYKACSEREAKQTAMKTVKALGLSDWRLTDVWSDDDGYESCCHSVSFSRLYGGIPASGNLEVQDEKHAFQSLSLEALTVRVENGVVTEVRLDNPMEMVELEKTELLPFDTVCACFKNEFGKRDMKKILAYGSYERPDGGIREDYHEADVRVAINRITMGLCPVKDAEEGGELRMIPVWMFSGIYSVDGNGSLTDGDVPIMVLNAIDGSVMEGNLGYRHY